MHDLQRHFRLESFSGVLPLFPLPGVVLFPCTLLPLHIFEARYRAMLEDAQAREGCIGMTLLRPGWESDYYGSPPIHEVACLGKLIETKRLEDGRYDIVLCGVKRVRIESVVKAKPFRTARVTLLEDAPFDGRDDEAELLRQRLFSAAERLTPSMLRYRNLGRALRKLDAPLGCSADLVADSLLLPAERKQELLEELDPIARSSELLRAIGHEVDLVSVSAGAIRRFPPEPSIN